MASGIKYGDIQWEDDDSDVTGDANKEAHAEQDNFAAMLDSTDVEPLHLRSGMQIQGRILSISQSTNDVIVEISPVQTGVLDKAQLQTPEGTLTHQVGDTITAYVISRGDEIQLSVNLSQSKQSGEDLKNAYRNRVPVKGKVTKENKGGFDVTILGKHAFCPVSQIDTHFVANKAEYLNKEFPFLITKYDEGGRNIVVSRAELLRQEAEKRLDDIARALPDAPVMEGVVRDIRDFGAFIDLGGLEGFVHISELSYARVNRIQDFLEKGDKVRVKVLRIEEKDGRRRMALSMKAVEDDPWSSLQDNFKAGETYAGKVMRLETFGAFVSLAHGVEGLVHVSEMSFEKRVNHPSQVVNVGDEVRVTVLAIDPSRQKISLSLKDKNADPWKTVDERFPIGSLVKGQVERLKGFGAIVDFGSGLSGLVPLATLKQAFGEAYRKHASPPKDMEVVIAQVDKVARKILLTLPNVKAADDDTADYQAYMLEEAQKEAAKAKTPVAQGSFGALLAAKLQQSNPSK